MDENSSTMQTGVAKTPEFPLITAIQSGMNVGRNLFFNKISGHDSRITDDFHSIYTVLQMTNVNICC